MYNAFYTYMYYIKVHVFLSKWPTKVIQMFIYDDQILNVHDAVTDYVCMKQIESPKADFLEMWYGGF